MTVIMRVEDQQPFAYTRDHHEFRRLADDSTWALESDGWLRSARSGRQLAIRVGDFYLDTATLAILYFEAWQ